MFASVHCQAWNIAIERFHDYKRVFSSVLASRLSALQLGPSLVEGAPGVFSRAFDPLSLNSRSSLDDVDLSIRLWFSDLLVIRH